jgi:hypothetical protein
MRKKYLKHSFPSGQNIMRKVGRPSKIDKLQSIIPTARDFIEANGYAAHKRRRTEIGSCGVTLGDIRKNLLANVPKLKEEGISISTVSRLLEPPRQGTKAALRYTGAIKARVPAKRNDEIKEHIDLHYCRSQVRMFREFMSDFAAETNLLSCDDKNKANVGTLAVSRYIKITRFFPKNDAPNYHDHDFPEPNSKLNPSGYIFLTAKEDDPVEVMDPEFRLHLNTPGTGDLYLYVRAVRFHPSTALNHANDLHQILTERPKTIVGIISDGGPDWNLKSMHNILIYGRLWMDLNLDYLGITHHAPGNSKENPIEHAWSPLSKFIVGVTLPRRNHGTDENKNFDAAVNVLLGHWTNKTYDDFDILPKAVLSNDVPAPYNDFEEIKMFGQNIKKPSKYSGLLKFVIHHSIRRCHGIEFVKCKEDSCEHCTSHPIQGVAFMQKLFEHGGMSLSPTPNPAFPGHFYTYYEMKTMPHLSKLDEHCPSIISKGLGSCQLGCKYTFLSKADKDRHMKFMHQKGKERSK